MRPPLAAARRMRRDPTEAERRLWTLLRGKRLEGLKFRRQHPVGRYVADFACVTARLVVELDGWVHDDIAVETRDVARERELEAQGWLVMRFRNNRVFEDPDGVLAEILEAARPNEKPLPRPGEG